MALQKTPMTAPSLMPALTPPSGNANPNPGKKSDAAQPSSKPFWIGLGVSVGWVCTVIGIIAKAGPTHNFGGIPLVDWAIGVSAAISPVAMVWMITAYLQRAADIQTIADPLRRQLTLITGESGAADARIRRFNQAIREQIELLRNAQTISQDDLEAIMDRVRQHRSELERFESASTSQVKEIQDVIRRSMFQAEQMMDDKFTMLRVLDGKLQQNSDGVARQVEGVRDQIANMLEEVEGTAEHLADALERAQRDSKKLSDTSRLQESSLTSAAEAASETLGGLSSKIDLSVTRFLERASSAREEAERLAHALDAQTRALDDFSTTLPVRVSEAESVLRGVADRLYASEQMAREQAVHLSEKLSQQVDGLQNFMDRFTSRLSDIDTGLDRRQTDLNSLGERIGATTGTFISSWEESLKTLNDRTGNSLLRFTVVNDETRRNTEAVVAQLSETTSKYEDVAVRMRDLSTNSNSQMKGMTDEISRQLGQFESLSKASIVAGHEVQERASSALQNLQHVLERVLAAREATQAVGETLVKDIYAAVDQNEKMINRLSETAQVSVRTIITATESLSRQEGDLVGKARAGEAVLAESVQKLQSYAESAGAGLRDQTTVLMNLLAEAQGQLAATDQKMKGFVSHAVTPVQKAIQQIDASAEQGLRTIGSYGDGLTHQVGRLEDFHTRIGGMSAFMGKATAESASAFEQLCERFAQARTAQDEMARQNLAQFSELSDRMQREVVGLDGQTVRAVDLLQQAALKVGEQSYQMLENAQNAGVKMKDVTVALQSEAMLIQEVVRKQTEQVTADLARAEQKFTTIGETIKERADTAHALLERTAAQYNDTSLSLSYDFEKRASYLSDAVAEAQGRVQSLNAALAGQSDRIGVDATKLEAHASEIAASSGRAVQNLSTLNDKLSATHQSAVTQAQHTLSEIEQCTTSFERKTIEMASAASTAVDTVYKASASFGEQTSKLVDGGHQVDAVLRQLTTATSSIAEQAAQIRNGIEQQNNRLLSQLSDSVAQLDVTGGKLQQVVAVATQGAEKASTQFADMAETALQRVTGATQDISVMASRAEATLAALGVNITQQAASLSVIGEQLGEQQKILAAANENQRAQMVDLFDKLGSAHKQASDVAERAIEHLSGSLQEITRQMGAVGDRSQEAVGVVKLASMGFSDQAVLLLQNAQAAEQQARTVLSVTSALQEQARHLRESLQAESERAGESLGTLLNRLASGGAEVRELGVDTTTVFTGLQRALTEQTSELGSSMLQIGDRQRNLVASLDQQRETINNLLNRLTLAQDETAAASERVSAKLGDGAQQITRYAETIDTKTQSALSNVRLAVSGFAQEAETIEQHARQAESQSRAILATASGIQGQIHDLRTSIQEDGSQTNAVLSTLLDKVTMGAAEIRDLSASTEMSLMSLGNNVTQQGSSLTTTMQQIGDRHRSLVGTLDAQRDVVNGLLNRLTLAQDETAATTDRTVSRLADGTQQITRQLDLMETQASTTLASIQGSVAGFSDQAGILNLQGQQAEQQMRGVLSVTSGMQEQARSLREAMQIETAHVIEQLTAVISQLDTANRQLKNESGVAIQTLESSTLQFARSTEAGAEHIRRQADTLSQTADQSEARLSTAGEKMRGQLRLVSEMGDQAEAQARQLADSAEFATTRLVSLRDTLVSSDKDGKQIGLSASARIEEVRTALQNQIQSLSELSERAVEQVTGASKLLATQSEALRSNLSMSESALTDAAGMLREESSHLPSILSRNVSEIEAASRSLKGYASETDQALIGTADRFISVTSSARSNMVDEMQRVASVADDADRVLRAFNHLLGEQVASIQKGTMMLSTEQRDLVEKAGLSVDALTSASDRLCALRTEASTTAERLAHEFNIIDQRASATSNRLTQAGEGMAKQIEAMSAVATRAETQLSGVSDSFREQLERIRAGLQSQIDDINRGLMQITAQLERTGASLRSTTVGAVADVERIGQRFEHTGGEAATKVDARMQQMRTATDEVSKMLSGFGSQFDKMLDHMANAGNGIKRQEGDMLGNLQKILTHLGAVAEKLDAARAMSGTVSHEAIERLDDVVNAVQAHMSTMTTSAQTAAGVMRGVGQIYSDQSQTLNRGVEQAHTQVMTMNKSIDEMQGRTDRMREALKLQGENLMSSLRQILTQLEMTGDGLTDAVNRTLEQQVEAGFKKIG